MDLFKANEGLQLFHKNYCSDENVHCDECIFNEEGSMMCDMIKVAWKLGKLIREED